MLSAARDVIEHEPDATEIALRLPQPPLDLAGTHRQRRREDGCETSDDMACPRLRRQRQHAPDRDGSPAQLSDESGSQAPFAIHG